MFTCFFQGFITLLISLKSIFWYNFENLHFAKFHKYWKKMVLRIIDFFQKLILSTLEGALSASIKKHMSPGFPWRVVTFRETAPYPLHTSWNNRQKKKQTWSYWLLLFTHLFTQNFLGKVLYWCWDVSSYNRRALASFMMMWIFLVTLGPRLHTSPSTSFCGALMHDIDINMGQYGSFHFSEGQKECKNLTQTGPYSIWHINSTLRKCTVSTVLNLLNGTAICNCVRPRGIPAGGVNIFSLL